MVGWLKSTKLGKVGSARESVRAHRFGWFLHFVSFDEAAAVAVGMWKAAFCAAFQARRRRGPCRPKCLLLHSPSVISTANCRISGIFLGFSPSNGRWEPNVGVSKTRAERALLQILVQSQKIYQLLSVRLRNYSWSEWWHFTFPESMFFARQQRTAEKERPSPEEVLQLLVMRMAGD